jgi:hypothetical protein
MRRRCGVIVVRQRNGWDCGVASLAMLLGVPYGDVAAMCRTIWGSTMPTRRGLGIYHLEELSAALGRRLRRVYRRDDYLANQTGVLGLVGGSMSWAGHWVVLKDGVTIIDPDGGEHGDVWGVTAYLKFTKARPATLLVEVE